MQINVKGKNVEITPALRAYAEQKLSRLDRYFHAVRSADVTQSVQRNWQIVEVTIEGDGALLRAEERSTDMYESIDLVAKKLEHQARHFKGKLIDRHREPRPRPDAEATLPEEREPPQPRVVRTKRFLVKPIAPDEATQQMELLNHDFFVFLNQETEQVNVVYRRKDGNYGLIEPGL